MSYTPNIPNSSDARAESQIQILSNYQTLNSVWAVNHVPLTSTDTQGQHNVLTLRNQSGDPTTASNQVALYNKLVSSIPELFFRPASNGTPIQLTYPSLTNGTPNIIVGTGYTNVIQQSFIAGPFVIYAGYIFNENGLADLIAAIALTPTSTLIYANANQSGSSSVFNSAYALNLNNPNPGNFSIGISGIQNTKVTIVYYFAIGM